MRYCNCHDVTSVCSLNSQKLSGHFFFGLGMRLYNFWLKRWFIHRNHRSSILLMVMYAFPGTLLLIEISHCSAADCAHSHSLRGVHPLLWRVVVFALKHFFWALICSTADYVHILSVMHILCSDVCLYLYRTFLVCICKSLMYQVQFTTLWAELLCIKGVLACTN